MRDEETSDKGERSVREDKFCSACPLVPGILGLFRNEHGGTVPGPSIGCDAEPLLQREVNVCVEL